MPDAKCVLLWVQRAKRATSNHAANHAIAIANELKLPVVAVFCMVPAYPRATLRSMHFMAGGLRELPAAFAARNVGWVLRVGDPVATIPRLARDLAAAVVVTDLDPLRTGREWRNHVAEGLGVPFIQVDTDTVVPTSFLLKEEWAPRTIRTKLAPHLDREIVAIPNPSAHVRSGINDGSDALDVLDTFALDRAVQPNPAIPAGEVAAKAALARFVRDRLDGYDTGRNDSARDLTSRLSPYLHFGQISPVDIAVACREARGTLAGPEAVDAFLSELITQRELAINFAMHNPNYDTYEGLPDWGRKTLAAHAADPRPVIHAIEEIEAGETIDPLWNACQRQLVGEGYMPNRLRMYWAKSILKWTVTPQDAFAIASALNDRYFLDGRDANGYAGVAWSIGGRHDRPFPPNRPILGLVRPMGANGMKKHFDVDAYIEGVHQRLG